MRVLKLIQSRRSIRRFKKEKISSKTIEAALEAGRWAPSGLNNQPWRFCVLAGESKDRLASFTHYGAIVKGADKVILVFLDKEASYHREKDIMAIGACIQNILLYLYDKGVGTCWLGEILNKKTHIQKQLSLKAHLELMGVIACGVPLASPKTVRRKATKELMI